jgi:hypothetical protein
MSAREITNALAMALLYGGKDGVWWRTAVSDDS